MPNSIIRILYVNANLEFLTLGKSFLEQYPEYSVDIINNSLTALEMIQSQKYDVVVSGYQMPVMNGIDLLKEIKKDNKAIPFIIFTGHGREDVVIDALNNGASYYIPQKGDLQVEFHELESHIRHIAELKIAEIKIQDQMRREQDIINFLPDATFAIDTHGRVIAWNRAMEEISGVLSQDIVGKGNYEYAIPFYHKRRPILIDFVLNESPDIDNYYPSVLKNGKILSAEEGGLLLFKEKTVYVWFTAAPLYDSHGSVTGAIESIRDITERKKSENIIRITNERLQIAQKIGQVGNWEFDVATGTIWASEEACKIFEIIRPKDGIISLEYVESKIPDRERVHQALVDLVVDNLEYNLEYAIFAKDSTPTKIIHSVARADRDQNGNPVKLYGVIQDITNRKKVENEILRKNEELQAAIEEITATEEELRVHLDLLTLKEQQVRESEEQFQALFMNMTEGVAVHDLIYDSEGKPTDYLIKKVNPAFDLHLGISQENLIGKTGREAYGVQDPPYLDIYAQVAESGVPEIFETYYPPLDKHFAISVYCPTKGSFATVFKDISEQKRSEQVLAQQYNLLKKTEEDLRQTKTYLENLISIANVPIIVWDSTFRITRMNNAFGILIGRSADEVIGKPFHTLFAPELVDLCIHLFQSSLKEARGSSTEIPVLHRDGSLRTILWNASTLFAQDGVTPIATIAQGRDVTEERRLEEEKSSALLQIQQNLAYLAILNDEIRNPLTIILTCADLINDEKIFDQICIQTQRIDEMVNQLDMRWIESEKVLTAIRKHYHINSGPDFGKKS